MTTNSTLPILFNENARMNKISANVPNEFSELIMRCCKTEPEQRPTIQECLDLLYKMQF